MSVTVERFDVSLVPDHGRPRVVEFRGREGKLSVHVERESGALWLFATGPAGGDRGHVVFPVRLAEQMITWLDEGAMNRPAWSSTGVLWLDWENEDERMLVVTKHAGRQSRWKMRLDRAARDELTACLREWAQAASRVTT